MSTKSEKKLDYQYYKEHKICVLCKRENAFNNHVLCPTCIEKSNNRWHNFTEERKKEVIKRTNEYQKQQKLKGLCIACGKPVCERSKQFCNEHRLKHNAYKREYHRKHKVYRTEEEREVIKAEKIKKLHEGYRRYQETERAKIHNARYKEIGSNMTKANLAKKMVIK